MQIIISPVWFTDTYTVVFYFVSDFLKEPIVYKKGLVRELIGRMKTTNQLMMLGLTLTPQRDIVIKIWIGIQHNKFELVSKRTLKITFILYRLELPY